MISFNQISCHCVGKLPGWTEECCDLFVFILRRKQIHPERFNAKPVQDQDAVPDGAGRESCGRGEEAESVQALREFSSSPSNINILVQLDMRRRDWSLACPRAQRGT